MLSAVPIAKAAPGWSPSRFQAPALRPRLGQAVITTPTTPPNQVVVMPGIESPKPAFIDSALVSFGISALGATGYGIMSYAYDQSKRPTWSKIFFGIAFAFGVKALIYDIPNIRYR